MNRPATLPRTSRGPSRKAEGGFTSRAPGVHSADFLLRAFDGCVVALLLFAPWFMGGRGSAGKLVFVALPVLAAVLWTVRRAVARGGAWRWSGAEGLLLAGVALVTVQIAPLSHDVLARLSPAIGQLLPLWSSETSSAVQLGQWSTLSLHPIATRGGLMVFLAYSLFFLFLVQRLETTKEIGQLLKLIAVSTILMAIVGLAQFFSKTESYLWVFQHPSAIRNASHFVRGAFQNENHLAHFLALGLGPLLWWIHRSSSSKPSGRPVRGETANSRSGEFTEQLLYVALAAVALAGLLTFSRGGVLVLAGTLILCLVLMRWKAQLSRRTTWILSIVAAVNCCALLIFGWGRLSGELNTVFAAGSMEELFDLRAELWRALWMASQEFPWLGTGVGSHADVYPTFMSRQVPLEFTHGESGFLPVLLETGIVGLALLVCGLLLAGTWLWRSLANDRGLGGHLGEHEPTRGDSDQRHRSESLVGYGCAVAPAFVASVVHSTADFVWYIPACMVLTIAQLACACRLYQLRGESKKSGLAGRTFQVGSRHSTPLSPAAFAVLAVALTVLGYAMVQDRWGAARASLDWNAYLRLSLAVPAEKQSPAQELGRLEEMQRRLTNVLAFDPQNGRAHLRLAATYLRQFDLQQRESDSGMELSQIRDAALASQFPSKAAQDEWLSRALGESRRLLDSALRHCRRAVALEPMQGLAYAYLAELSFLETPRAAAKQAYIQQATAVRPHDGVILFMRGKEALLVGDHDLAISFWKLAFRQSPESQQLVIATLIDLVPAADFLQEFKPDAQALYQLFSHYRQKERPADCRLAGDALLAQIETDVKRQAKLAQAGSWSQAREVHVYFQRYPQAIECQTRAVQLNPSSVDDHRMLAELLVHERQFDLAIEQYEWCVRRQPDNESFHAQLAEARTQARSLAVSANGPPRSAR